ncbi:MAG: arylsulfatase [Candidatus Nealsonbacteria bacterium]|nr:arylsulfatase [Candidatus Nealsonbacteria bacterium]
MWHRPTRILIVLTAWFTLAASTPTELAAQLAARGPQPNIVIILADDLGFSDLGCYGSEILTPNLDKLAKNGLRFTQFYNCGRCCPTRASLLTGLHPHQAGVGHMMNDYRRPGYRGNLNKQCVTIAQLLKTAGYQTMMCGKWHVSRYVDPAGPKFNWPQQRGFDKSYGTIHGGGSYFDPATLCRDNHFIRRPDEEDYYYTDAISDQAAKYVEQAVAGTKPFFLYVAYTAPHWPLHVPRVMLSRYRTQYTLGWDTLREQRHRRMIALGIVDRRWPLSPRDPRVRSWELNSYKPWQQRRMEVYAAQVDMMDQGIGRILERVRQTGAERNTLVMFLSDNGGCAEEVASSWKGLHVPERTHGGRSVQVGNNPNVTPGGEDTYQSYGLAWANASNTPFRLYKHQVHEGGIATPMIVRWPEVITDGGGLTHQVGHVLDIMPTCLRAAKIAYPTIHEGLTLLPPEGKSLIPIFQGQTRQQSVYFWEHEGNRAVRDGKWKLVSRHPGTWELYDIVADRTELNDLAAKFPIIVQGLARSYDAWAKRCNVEPWRK